MERKEGLKPCPFCGRTNQRFLMDMDIYSYPQNRGRRAIICDCGLRLYASNHAEAEEKWQDRLYDKFVKELTEENERLKASRYMAYPDGRLELIPSIESIKADTVRKMQEKLKERFSTETRYTKYSGAGVVMVIDQIAKEMVEEVK